MIERFFCSVQSSQVTNTGLNKVFSIKTHTSVGNSVVVEFQMTKYSVNGGHGTINKF